MEKGKPNLKKILVIAGAAVVAIVALVAVFVGSQKLTATTMRLLKKEGEVKLYDRDKEKTIIDNLRLASGNALTTAAESIASIALDDTKIVTLNNNSRADFEQNGKKLKINLTEGSLFFQVKEKLEADASFDIKTANLVVGIRGTSGLVEANPDGTHSVTITDGEVEVSIVNKETGQSKTIRVKAGEKAKIILHDNSVEDTIEVIMDELKESDLGTVITDRLVEDEDLMIKVCDATGWNEEAIRMVNENPEALVATSDGSDDPDGTDPDGTPGGEGTAQAGEGGEAAGDGNEAPEVELLTQEPEAAENGEKTEESGENAAVAEGSDSETKENSEAKDAEGKKEDSKEAADKTAEADKKETDGKQETAVDSAKQDAAKTAEAEKQKAEAEKQKAAEAAKKKEAEAAKQREAEAAKQAAAAEAARQQEELARQQAAAAEAAKQAEAQKQAEWEKFQAAIKAAEEEAKEKERQEQAAAAAAAAPQQSSSGDSQSSSGSQEPKDDSSNPGRDDPWNDPNYNPDSDPWSDPDYDPDSDPYSDPNYNPDGGDPYSDPNYNPDGNDPNYNPDGTEGGNP